MGSETGKVIYKGCSNLRQLRGPLDTRKEHPSVV